MPQKMIFATVVFFLLAGCSRINPYQQQVISQNLPLSLKDIDEIRAGDEAHRQLLKDPSFKLYQSPELKAYVTLVGKKIAGVSDRPYLPYQFFVIDKEEIDVFGYGGGRVYVTRGFFDFISSENELAGGLAHEIGHIANRQYQPEGDQGKMEKTYHLLVKATDMGADYGGAYISAGQKGLKYAGKYGPKVKKRFSGDQEQQADKDAVRYLMKAGYDPRGLHQLIEKLAQVGINDVGKYVDYMKSHPPLPERRGHLAAWTEGYRPPKVQLERGKDTARPELPKEPEMAAKTEVAIGDIPSGQSKLPAVDATALGAKS